MKLFALRAAKLTAYVVGASFIMFALLVTAARLITPILDAHKEEIEKWASKRLGTPVEIDEARLSWYAYEPQMSLKNVKLINKENHEPIIQVKNIQISISIPDSLYQRRIVPGRLILDGSVIKIESSKDGKWQLHGFVSDVGESYDNQITMQSAVAWLTMQDLLSLKNIEIFYQAPEQPLRHFRIRHVTLENDDDHHHLSGRGILVQPRPTELSFSVRFEGDALSKDQFKANLYLYVHQLSLPQWLQARRWQGLKVDAGLASFKIWAEWQHNDFQNIRSLLLVKALKLSLSQHKTEQFDRLSAYIGLRKQGDEYQFIAQDVIIDQPGMLWPVTDVAMTLKNQQGMLVPKMVSATYLNIEDTLRWLNFSDLLAPLPIPPDFKNLKAKGAIYNLKLEVPDDWQNDQGYELEGYAKNLHVDGLSNLPKIDNASFAVLWQKQKGKIAFDSQHLVLHDKRFYSKPLIFNNVQGDVALDHQNHWVVDFEKLRIETNALRAEIDGSLHLYDQNPYADLNVHLAIDALHNLRYELPDKILNSELHHWLTNAFDQGSLQDGELKLKGPLRAFPFKNQAGEFYANLPLKNVTLVFAPSWPKLKDMQARLLFTNQSMKVIATQANIDEIKLNTVNAEIKDLTANALHLSVKVPEVQTQFANAITFMNQTPLKDTLGKRLAGVQLSGPMTLSLQLEVPLHATQAMTTTGSIATKGSILSLPMLNLAVEELRGQIHFTDTIIKSDGLQGTFFKRPMTIKIVPIKDGKTSYSRAFIQTTLNFEDLKSHYQLDFRELSGETNAEFRLDLKDRWKIKFQSNLYGAKVQLPENLAKEAFVSSDFHGTLTKLKDENLELYLNYKEKLKVAALLKEAQARYKLATMNLHLGHGEAVLPSAPGLFVTADFDKFTFEQLQDYFPKNNDKEFSLPLQNLRASIKNFSVGGQQLSDAFFTVENDDDHFDIDLRSKQATGYLQVPKEFNNAGKLNLVFTNLELKSSETESGTAFTTLTSLPAIHFSAQRLSVNDMYLGQTQLKSHVTQDGLSIDHLTMRTPSALLKASGLWHAQKNQTTLKGEISARNVSQFLGDLDLELPNFTAANGEMTFNFNWQGQPFKPSLKTLGGRARLQLGSGRIIEVGKESEAKMDLGKMLSIFNLNRLSTGFSDVFQKGYSFNTMYGSFIFKGGNAYTENLYLDGAVAKIAIAGRIGLSEKDFDLRLSVTAKVTSSIPVAATLLTGWQPWFGVAALAANALLGSQISKATTYTYDVRGTWENPIWKQTAALDA